LKRALVRFLKLLKGYLPDGLIIVMNFFISHGRFPNVFRPRSLNEKIIWLKIYDRHSWHAWYADKISVKEIIARAIGPQYNVPLLAVFADSQSAKAGILELKPPYIIKPNHDSGGGQIVRSPRDIPLIDWSVLEARLSVNYYRVSRERQYRDVSPKLMVETLLGDGEKVPNDYKFHVINGRVAFIYCSIDRLGANYRKIYDNHWRPTGMMWGPPENLTTKFSGPDICIPRNFELMVALAEKLSLGFCYLRVDFYEVEGKVYVGELTQHQYSGNCPILPVSEDLRLGAALKLHRSAKSIPY
jgi:hypothetical protein